MVKDKWRIPKAISYTSWTQLLLDTDKFSYYFNALKETYNKDKQFQEYMSWDAKMTKRELNENQINFFLEEHLLLYLIVKGKVPLKNEFVQGKEKWVLNCYPGKPLWGQMYLHKENFFELENLKNKYENSWYDLEEKKLYDFERVDLETIKL